MVSARTHYDLLGVSTDASIDEIRRAYRALVKHAHPDAGGDAETFRQIHEAYETLTNPLLRREYDDRNGLRRVTYDPAAGGGSESASWSGRVGAFTGDVEFPAWLRDIAEAPWGGSFETGAAAAEQVDAPGDRTSPAEILWWWPEGTRFDPVVTGQVVVVARESTVVALDVLTGHELWRASTAAPVPVPPEVFGDLVLVWTADGTVHGLELGRGVTQWETTVGTPAAGGVSAAGSIVVAATAERRLVALDPALGRTCWSAHLAGTATMPLVVTPALVIAATEHRTVEAVELRKGRHRWRVNARLPVDLPPMVTGEIVWVSAGSGVLHRLDAERGAPQGVWQAGSAIAGLAARDELLYATVAGPPQLVVLDSAGRLRLAVATRAVCPEPALVGGRAYVVSREGTLSTIDLESARTIAETELPFPPVGAPVYHAGRLLVREHGGRLWAVAPPEWHSAS